MHELTSRNYRRQGYTYFKKGEKSRSATVSNFLPRPDTVWGTLVRRALNSCQDVPGPNFGPHVFFMLLASVPLGRHTERWRLSLKRALQKQARREQPPSII